MVVVSLMVHVGVFAASTPSTASERPAFERFMDVVSACEHEPPLEPPAGEEDVAESVPERASPPPRAAREARVEARVSTSALETPMPTEASPVLAIEQSASPARETFVVTSEPSSSPTTTALVTSATPGGEGVGGASSRGAGRTRGEGGSAVEDSEALRAYRQRVRARVVAERRYPSSALRVGLEGRVVVLVEIVRDGSARIVEVDGRGADAVLIAAATDAVRRASPFPRIPDEITRDALQTRLPIDFRLSGD